MLFTIQVFGGGPYDVGDNGLCQVYWAGGRKLYERRPDEDAIAMQKRVEEDITKVEREKVHCVLRVYSASMRLISGCALCARRPHFELPLRRRSVPIACAVVLHRMHRLQASGLCAQLETRASLRPRRLTQWSWTRWTRRARRRRQS